MKREKIVPITRKTGEVNGVFGRTCNRIVQVGGAVLTVLAVPIAAFLGSTIMETHNIAILNQQRMEMYIQSHGVTKGEFKELQREHRADRGETLQRLVKHGDLIREHQIRGHGS